MTGEEKYLEARRSGSTTRRCSGRPPAARTSSTGLHANTQIPKFIGAARRVRADRRATGCKRHRRFFWDTVVNERSYVIGGHSDGEMFSPKEKLSQALRPEHDRDLQHLQHAQAHPPSLLLGAAAEYADYYERALYNHILASQNPETGMMCYYVPLRVRVAQDLQHARRLLLVLHRHGHREPRQVRRQHLFPRRPARPLREPLHRLRTELEGKGLTVRQETKYPGRASTRLRFACDQPVELTLHVRHPWWATAGFQIRVNGKPQEVASRAGRDMRWSPAVGSAAIRSRSRCRSRSTPRRFATIPSDSPSCTARWCFVRKCPGSSAPAWSCENHFPARRRSPKKRRRL